jgi:predicted dehydrogenase
MIAREHLSALAELENVEIGAVCDLSRARAEAMAERFRIARWYTDLEQLLTNVRPDLVHITTPPSSHFSIAKRCLSAGLNVLCEKPIALDYQEFSLLKQIAIERHCFLMENQNLRFHSSVRRVRDLIASGKLGDVLDLQIVLSLNIASPGSLYLDQNAPHFSTALRGGVIGDFLTHIAYLAFMFTGSIRDLRTVWTKHFEKSPLLFDEFRAFIKGERATGYVAFSGNAQPSGFWVRVLGTKMQLEINLYEPPRITTRRFRRGEPALTSLVEGIAESRDVLRGSIAGFWRKLGGVSAYDGLPELIAATYGALDAQRPQPVALDEIDEVARLVDRLTAQELKL